MDSSKQLKRIPERGQVAGVCAGFAEYLDIDVSIIRVIFIVLMFLTSGGMLLAYFILAVVLPPETNSSKHLPSGKNEKAVQTSLTGHINTLTAEMKDSGRVKRLRQMFGIGLAVIGTWLLLVQLYPGWFNLRGEYIWPILLIVSGILIVARRRNA